MPMKVETVDILVEKAHFEPQVAVTVAQAMDVAMEEKMRDRQLVTVTQLAEAKVLTRLERLGSELRAELEIAVTSIRAELESTATAIRAELGLTATAIRAEIASTAAAIRAELRAEIQAAAAKTTSDLLRHMYTAMAAQMALLLGIAYFFSLHVK